MDFLTALVIIYLTPLLRILLFFIPPLNFNILHVFNAAIGRIEWLIQKPRDSVLLLFLAVFAALKIYDAEFIGALAPTAFAFVSVFAVARKIFHARRMAEFGKENGFIYPSKFFKYYYSGFGFIPVKLPSSIKSGINPANVSFKTGHPPKLAILPVIAGVVNTYILSRIILAAFKWKGPVYSSKVANGLSKIWGARVAELGRFSIKVTGMEQLNGLDGKFIFVFNHKSYLDFAIGPFALSGKKFDFKFMAARDHFLDNPLIYRTMGLALEVVGTIFVDRKRRETSPKEAAAAAVEKLISSDVDVVLFPQGTRALGNTDVNGKRLDSGYYTSGTRERLLKSGGHIKKGAAYIAVDVSIALKNRERSIVHIVPVGLIGTGLAAPKKSILIRKGSELFVKVGAPISIKCADVKNIEKDSAEYKDFVENIHHQIDERFKDLLEIHARLEQRFFRDLRGLLPASDFEHVSVAMKAWRGKDYLIYTIIDCIYAAKPKRWQELQRELSYLLTSDAPLGSILHFKERVIDIIGIK
jgi:1-acyl-sn-glycerol-3-phosphate acyltransferase